MTAPTLTRLGELRTAASGYYDAGEQNASVQLHTIDGVMLRRDDTGATAPLYPGEGYEIRPNDGWAVDRPGIDRGPGHWAHLVDMAGDPVQALPLLDGTLILDRTHRYLLRQDGWRSAWIVYQI